jgi:pSer/pThr/pTyr-binding forkhead associated (FHA) protein
MEKNRIVGRLRVQNKTRKEIALIELQMGENSIGRASDSENENFELMNDHFLSRKHFIIETEEDSYSRIRFYLKDENLSTNGTWLRYNKNGTIKKLEAKDFLELSNGDTILGGETYFVIEINPELLEYNQSVSNTSVIN